MIYSLNCNTFGRKFSFNAKSISDAISKAKSWCVYQGVCFNEEFTVTRVSKVYKYNDLHNEYVS